MILDITFAKDEDFFRSLFFKTKAILLDELLSTNPIFIDD